MEFEYVLDGSGSCLISQEGDLPANNHRGASRRVAGRSFGEMNGVIRFTSLRAASKTSERSNQASGGVEKTCIWSESSDRTQLNLAALLGGLCGHTGLCSWKFVWLC
jgi:hypothetical protein